MNTRTEVSGQVRTNNGMRRALATNSYVCLSLGLFYTNTLQFVLFHQPDEKSLEVIKLTGDVNVPRGAYWAMADDLTDIKRICSEEEWPEAPVVSARMQVASSGFSSSMFEYFALFLDLISFYLFVSCVVKDNWLIFSPSLRKLRHS